MFVLQIVLLGADNSQYQSARLRFYLAVFIGNYLLNSSVFEVLQFAIVYILGIEKRQIKAQFGAFFQIIDQYREEIKNNNNYVAGVVHDLRNPLTEIYSCSELLGQLIPEHSMTQDMQSIVMAFRRNSENLISMVGNIMDYAKIKSKKLELDIQPNNIREFFTKIYQMHAVKARQKNIKLTMFMDEESLPEKLLFDQSRLTNILVNIASNAIKFTNKGGVQIHAHWFPDST